MVTILAALDDPFRGLIAGTLGGGLFKRNIHYDWHPINTGFQSARIGRIAVAGTPPILYVLSASSFSFPYGRFLYRTEDSGKVWQNLSFRVPVRCTALITSVAINPHNPDHVILLTETASLAGNDEGKTWKRNRCSFETVIFDPIDSNIVYFTSYPGVVYKSMDGGRSRCKNCIPVCENCTVVQAPDSDRTRH